MTTHAREGWIHNDGLALRYVEWGSPTEPAIVALHGLRSFAYTWEPVALPLAGRYRVIALDQRGRGMSDWDPERQYFAERYVSDLEVLVDDLALDKFVLVGHSMGGANAFVYASRHAERLAGMVIEDMGPGASASSAGAERIRRELRSTPTVFDSWNAATAFWRAQRPNISEDSLTARVRHSMRSVEDGSVMWCHDGDGIAQARLNATPAQLVDLWPFADALDCPTLLVRGANSDFLSKATGEAMRDRNPNIEFVEIAGASHYVHDDNLKDFEDALHGFLESPRLSAWRRNAL